MTSGIRFGSPALASAIVNLVPAFTFILAIISRLVVFILWLKLQGLFFFGLECNYLPHKVSNIKYTLSFMFINKFYLIGFIK